MVVCPFYVGAYGCARMWGGLTAWPTYDSITYEPAGFVLWDVGKRPSPVQRPLTGFFRSLVAVEEWWLNR